MLHLASSSACVLRCILRLASGPHVFCIVFCTWPSVTHVFCDLFITWPAVPHALRQVFCTWPLVPPLARPALNDLVLFWLDLGTLHPACPTVSRLFLESFLLWAILFSLGAGTAPTWATLLCLGPGAWPVPDNPVPPWLRVSLPWKILFCYCLGRRPVPLPWVILLRSTLKPRYWAWFVVCLQATHGARHWAVQSTVNRGPSISLSPSPSVYIIICVFVLCDRLQLYTFTHMYIERYRHVCVLCACACMRACAHACQCVCLRVCVREILQMASFTRKPYTHQVKALQKHVVSICVF